MPDEHVDRRLAAILAADVVGYSRLMGFDEEGTLSLLKKYRRELLEPKIVEHGGRIVKTTGDGVLIEFASAVNALRYAPKSKRPLPSAGVSNERVFQHMEALFGRDNFIALRERLKEPNVNREAVIMEYLITAMTDAGAKFVLPFRFKNEISLSPTCRENQSDRSQWVPFSPLRMVFTNARASGTSTTMSALPQERPQSGHVRCTGPGLLWANRRHWQSGRCAKPPTEAPSV